MYFLFSIFIIFSFFQYALTYLIHQLIFVNFIHLIESFF